MEQNNFESAGERTDGTSPFEDLAGSGQAFLSDGGTAILVGARSASSGVEVFPTRPLCPETGARDMQEAHFGPEATLYSFSTVHVSASHKTPYTLGYIDFPCGMRTLAIIRGTPEALSCDLPVILRCDDEDWWAEPVETAGAA